MSGPVTTDARRVLRRLVLPVYLPIVAGTFGIGMLIPVLPLYLEREGLDLATVGVVLASVGVGAAVGGVPAGGLVERVGERRLLVGSLVAIGVSTALLGLTTAVVALVALRVATGAAHVTMRLSRQGFITQRVETRMRGRAMSLIGGSFRLASLLGPLLGGVLTDAVGFRATFAVAGAVTLLGTVPAFLGTPPGSARSPVDGRRPSMLDAVRHHRRSLLRAGLVPVLFMTVREGRYVVLPLIADDLGLSAGEVGVVIAIGNAADLLLFPLSGWVMDTFGRLHAMVPALALIGGGLVVVGLADSALGVVVGGAVIGIGNGSSAGTILTLGSDLAPPEAPGPFLAGMSVMADAGRIVGPVLVGVVAGAAGLGTAALVLAGVAGAAIAWLVLVVGDTAKAGSGAEEQSS